MHQPFDGNLLEYLRLMPNDKDLLVCINTEINVLSDPIQLLKDAMSAPSTVLEASPTTSHQRGKSEHLEEVSQKRHQERVEQYRKIHELSAKHVDLANIGRQVGVSRRTVYRYLQMDQPPERRSPCRTHAQLIEPFKPYLVARWNEGCRNGQQMWREIMAQGYSCSESNVRRFIAGLRKSKGKAHSFKHVEPTLETRVSKTDAKLHRPPNGFGASRMLALPETWSLQSPLVCDRASETLACVDALWPSVRPHDVPLSSP